MASVWQHPKTPNWFARYRGPNGKTVNRSTGITDREESVRIAQQWEIEAAREREKRPKGEVSPGGISDTIAKAERLARQGRLDSASAREIVNGLLSAAGHERLDAVTNRVWCDGWRAGKKGAVKESSRLKYDQVCRDWLAFLNAKAGKPLEIIGKTETVAFRDRLASLGLSPRTVNHTIKLLRGVYGEAVEQGHLGRNPFIGVQTLREGSEISKRKPFSRDDVAALLSAAKGDWKGLILLAAILRQARSLRPLAE
jgi:integrase